MHFFLKSIYDLIGLDDNLKFDKDNNPTFESPLVRTEQIFEKMDIDLNGVITEQEFITGCLQDKPLYQMLTATNLNDSKCSQ